MNRKYGNGLAGTECRQLISTRYSPLTRRADNRAVSGPLFDVPALLELLPELPKLRPPATVINKTRYSVEPELLSQLQAREADGLIVIGSETDVCVLATVLGAVDLGYRVILILDAVCSSSDEGHDALMQISSALHRADRSGRRPRDRGYSAINSSALSRPANERGAVPRT